jgi:uncharacterized protein (DUF924 family)
MMSVLNGIMPKVVGDIMCESVLSFWFEEIEPKHWFVKDPDFDALIEGRFASVHRQAQAGELYKWRVSPEGRLAEVIVLDQFSRNMFRDTPKAFACDSLALILAQEAIASKADKALSPIQRSFLYMPFMHSESRTIHEVALALFSQKGLEGNLDFEIRHKEIIDRFGRYPHRNAILGRESSAEELEFLKHPGSSF